MDIPYHQLPLESEEKTPWLNKKSITLISGAEIAVYDKVVPNNEGLFIKITRPLPDGNQLVLKFALSHDAALVLTLLLSDKLSERIESAATAVAAQNPVKPE